MKQKILIFSAIVLTLCNFSIWFFVLTKTTAAGGDLIVSFLDIGQGDAILIKTPNGNRMLIDGGPDKKILEQIGNELPFGEKKIDVVLATHPDSDHIGGLPYIFDQYEIGAYFDSGVQAESPAYLAIKQRIFDEVGEKYFHGNRGMKIILDEKADVVFEIFSPAMVYENADTNTTSIVGKLKYAGQNFLFTGDAPQGVEDYLVDYFGEELNSQVLKVGHHGSKTSTSQKFVKQVLPEFAIISSGVGNTYGHPTVEVLEILQTENVKILRTDQSGTIQCRVKAGKLGCE
jgi:competence protein ComEC